MTDKTFDAAIRAAFDAGANALAAHLTGFADVNTTGVDTSLLEQEYLVYRAGLRGSWTPSPGSPSDRDGFLSCHARGSHHGPHPWTPVGSTTVYQCPGWDPRMARARD